MKLTQVKSQEKIESAFKSVSKIMSEVLNPTWFCPLCPQSYLYPTLLQQHFEHCHGGAGINFAPITNTIPSGLNDRATVGLSQDDFGTLSVNQAAPNISQMSQEGSLPPDSSSFQLLQGNLKCGGSNFYSLEFAEKLQRSLPFIQPKPRKRFLNDWKMDTPILNNLGLERNVEASNVIKLLFSSPATLKQNNRLI